MKRRQIPIIILVILLLSANVALANKQGMGDPQAPEIAGAKTIEEIRAKFNRGDYAGTRLDAGKFIQTHPSSTACPEAQYLIALSYLKEANEPAAREELDRYMKNYPNAAKAAEASATLRTLEARRFQEMYDAAQRKQAALEEQNRKISEAVEEMRKTAKTDKIYIVIDVQADMIMVKMGNATLYSFPCATGKGEGYLAATGGIEAFYTPRGKLSIIKKEKDPVWVRPNWYWLERGEEVPEGITNTERSVHGYLGKYKLDLGDQFYIHGHPGGVKPGKYTHGCIRVNDDDLQILWNITEVGTEVYIF